MKYRNVDVLIGKFPPGTEIYMAPELMQSKVQSKGYSYTNMVDSWSFGVLLYIWFDILTYLVIPLPYY